jgi:lipopolysaccharide export LptBFGC system permease protein LptF
MEVLYYRSGLLGTIINSILIVLFFYLIIRGLVFLIPVGIVVWAFYRLYKYITNINFKKGNVKEDSTFSKVEKNEEIFDYDINNVIDVEYETINK